jgi:hypothetical protein
MGEIGQAAERLGQAIGGLISKGPEAEASLLREKHQREKGLAAEERQIAIHGKKMKLLDLKAEALRSDPQVMLGQLAQAYAKAKTPRERAQAQKAFNLAGEVVEQYSKYTKAKLFADKEVENFVPLPPKPVEYQLSALKSMYDEAGGEMGTLESLKHFALRKIPGDMKEEEVNKIKTLLLTQMEKSTTFKDVPTESNSWAAHRFAEALVSGDLDSLPESFEMPASVGYINQKGKRGKTIFRPKGIQKKSVVGAKYKVGDVVDHPKHGKVRITKIGPSGAVKAYVKE